MFGRERVDWRDSYVRGLVVVARVRRVRRRSFWLCSGLSAGRLGVSIAVSLSGSYM